MLKSMTAFPGWPMISMPDSSRHWNSWVMAHGSDPVAAYMVNKHLIYEADYDQLHAWAEMFGRSIPDSRYTQMLTEEMAF